MTPAPPVPSPAPLADIGERVVVLRDAWLKSRGVHLLAGTTGKIVQTPSGPRFQLDKPFPQPVRRGGGFTNVLVRTVRINRSPKYLGVLPREG